jgi:hypothetical protein
MKYFTDISSMPEFKAYEGKKGKLGGFDKIRLDTGYII